MYIQYMTVVTLSMLAAGILPVMIGELIITIGGE
jgi:hypothetical protein